MLQQPTAGLGTPCSIQLKDAAISLVDAREFNFIYSCYMETGDSKTIKNKSSFLLLLVNVGICVSFSEIYGGQSIHSGFTRYTNVCKHCYHFLSSVKKITDILFRWDSNPRPLQF